MSFDFVHQFRKIKDVYPRNKYANFDFIKYFNLYEDILPAEFAGERFFTTDTQFIVLPSYVGDRIDFLIFRSVVDKKFNYVGYSNLFYLYGLDKRFSNFKYGMPIVVVEGALDCETTKTIYPYVVGILSSVMSDNQLNYLTSLTNNFVLMLDADDAGREGTEKTIKKLKRLNCVVNTLDNFGDLKDISDMWALDSFDKDIAISYYEEMLKNLCNF